MYIRGFRFSDLLGGNSLIGQERERESKVRQNNNKLGEFLIAVQVNNFQEASDETSPCFLA